MNPIKSLISTDHGLFGILLVIGATILACLGHVDWQQWQDFAKWIFGIFAGSHAVISIGDSLGSSGDAQTGSAQPSSAAKQVATVTPMIALFVMALAVALAMPACGANMKAKETAIINGVIDCSKAQASFGDVPAILKILGDDNWKSELEQLALAKGEAVVACSVKDAVAILTAKKGAELTPEAKRASSYVADKGYRFK